MFIVLRGLGASDVLFYNNINVYVVVSLLSISISVGSVTLGIVNFFGAFIKTNRSFGYNDNIARALINISVSISFYNLIWKRAG